MGRNILNKYVNDQLESIRLNTAEFLQDENPECLHHLRINIKKIRAVCHFAEKVCEKETNVKALKSIFDQAGQIRELQILAGLLSSLHHPPKRLLCDLKKKESLLIDKFSERGKKNTKKITNMQSKICFENPLRDKNRIKNYFENEWAKADKLILKNDRISLHQYRMRLKKLMYIFNLLPDRIQKDLTLNVTLIEKLQTTLGDWHDMYASIKLIENERIPSKTKRDLHMLKEKEKKQFDTFYADIAPNYNLA